MIETNPNAPITKADLLAIFAALPDDCLVLKLSMMGEQHIDYAGRFRNRTPTGKVNVSIEIDCNPGAASVSAIFRPVKKAK